TQELDARFNAAVGQKRKKAAEDAEAIEDLQEQLRMQLRENSDLKAVLAKFQISLNYHRKRWTLAGTHYAAKERQANTKRMLLSYYEQLLALRPAEEMDEEQINAFETNPNRDLFIHAFKAEMEKYLAAENTHLHELEG